MSAEIGRRRASATNSSFRSTPITCRNVPFNFYGAKLRNSAGPGSAGPNIGRVLSVLSLKFALTLRLCGCARRLGRLYIPISIMAST